MSEWLCNDNFFHRTQGQSLHCNKIQHETTHQTTTDINGKNTNVTKITLQQFTNNNGWSRLVAASFTTHAQPLNKFIYTAATASNILPMKHFVSLSVNEHEAHNDEDDDDAYYVHCKTLTRGREMCHCSSSSDISTPSGHLQHRKHSTNST